jgi:ribose transport system permease protein
MIVFIAYAVLAYIVLDKTRFGRYVYAVGANETAAVYSAIKVHTIRTITYIISGVSVATSAILLSSMMASVSSSSTGSGFELDAIAAAVIGGTSLSGGKGTIFGTFFGALILGVVNNMLVMLNVAVYLQGMVKGLIIIAAVLLQNLRK